MSLENFIIVVFVGGLAGWLSGVLTKGSGFGLLGNVIVGIVGAILAHFLFGLLGIRAHRLTGQIVFTLLGAIGFAFLLRRIKR